jgi:hypothetical protein
MAVYGVSNAKWWVLTSSSKYGSYIYRGDWVERTAHATRRDRVEQQPAAVEVQGEKRGRSGNLVQVTWTIH